MEPMSIACTTCQARLKVRDRRAIGQILPCPRCRSMVHVHPELLKSETQWAANSSAALPASYSLPELPPSDSFDHIDQLLDGTVQIRRVKRSSGASRWRTASDRGDVPTDASSPASAKPPSPMTRAATSPTSSGVSPSAVPGNAQAPLLDQAKPADVLKANRAEHPAISHAVSSPSVPLPMTSAHVDVPSDSRWSIGDEIRAEMAQMPATPLIPKLHPAARIVSNVSAGPLPVWSDEPITSEDVEFLTRKSPTRWWRAKLLRPGLIAATALLACGGVAFWLLREPLPAENDSANRSNAAVSVRSDSASNSTIASEESPTPPDDDSKVAAEIADTTNQQADESRQDDKLPHAEPLPDAEVVAAQEPSAELPGTDSPAEATAAAAPGEVASDPVPTPGDVSKPSEDAPPQEPPGTPIAADDELSQLARWLKQPAAPAGQAVAKVDVVAPDEVGPATAAADPVEEQIVMVPTRPLPPRVDVDSRLKMTVSACRFQGTPLIEVLRSLSDLSTIPITLDADSLGRVQQRCDRPVQLDLRNASLRTILEGALRDSKLGYEVREGQLRIVTADEQSQTVVTYRHDVSDLTKGEPRAAQAMANWITQLIAFGSWQSQVKPDADQTSRDESLLGTIQVDGAVLQVAHRDAVQFQIIALLDKLRIARGLPTRGELLEEHTKIGGVTSTFQRFDRPITLRAWRGNTLNQILEQFEQQADVRILVDWESLHAMGWAPGDEWKFFCRETSLRDALPRLFNGTGLSYRIVDSRTLQVVSTPSLMERHDVEVYSLRREGLNAAAVQKFCLELAQRLGRDKFQPQGRGALAYDAQSQHLVVSLPQRDQEAVQARIVEWLAK